MARRLGLGAKGGLSVLTVWRKDGGWTLQVARRAAYHSLITGDLGSASSLGTEDSCHLLQRVMCNVYISVGSCCASCGLLLVRPFVRRRIRHPQRYSGDTRRRGKTLVVTVASTLC